jgi:hypothetical protein
MLACHAASAPGRSPDEHRRHVWLQALPLQRFHVLFDSLSKVLFIFRSHYLCAIGLWPVFSFRRSVPPNLELHSQTTRLVEGALHGEDLRPSTGFSPSATPCSKGPRPRPTPKHPLQITTRARNEPDFKFELLPLHSPLLRQSLLVSFPPLIDMLKFSGYPYLIRGQR